jgi:cytidylate kinase
MSVVTIRGQLGSGASEVGRLIAEKLHADYVDRQIIAEVATRLHRQEREIVAKEKPPSGLLGRITEALGRNYGFGDGLAGAYLPIEQFPLDDTRYLQALEYVVKDLARSPSIVILGRGSQFILKGYPGVLHVLVVASIAVRVKRIMQDLKLDAEAAKIEITRHDRSLREFIKRYFKAEIEDPVHYDLVVNTKTFSYETAASIAIDALSLEHQDIAK